MDWPHYSPPLHSAEDETELSPFAGADYSLDPALLFSPIPHLPSDLFFDPPPDLLSVPEPLISPELVALYSSPWPSIEVTSPPSPTASVASIASTTTSSSSSSRSPASSDHSTRSSTPVPHRPSDPCTEPTSSSCSSGLPATLAVSPYLLEKLHRPLLPPATSPADASAAANGRQRKRIAGLTTQQRAELKRRKHREIDANRIQREKAAVKRLTLLTSAQQQQQLDRVKRERIDDEEEEAEEGRRDKVTVLEDSAKKIDELQRLVSRLTDACNAQHSNNRSLVLQLQQAASSPSSTAASSSAESSHLLSLLPSGVSQQLEAHIGSASLHASWFMSSSVCITILRCSTGCVLDVNERMVMESGWQRDQLVGRLLAPPYDYIVQHASYSSQRFAQQTHLRPPVRGPDGRLVPGRTQPQYTRSKALIHQLYRDQLQHIHCVFRYQMIDGRVYEVKYVVWITNWIEEPPDADGRVRRRPENAVMVSSYADAVCVDEAQPLEP